MARFPDSAGPSTAMVPGKGLGCSSRRSPRAPLRGPLYGIRWLANTPEPAAIACGVPERTGQWQASCGPAQPRERPMTARTLLLACRVCVVVSIFLTGSLGQNALAAPGVQGSPIPLGYGQTVEGEI